MAELARADSDYRGVSCDWAVALHLFDRAEVLERSSRENFPEVGLISVKLTWQKLVVDQCESFVRLSSCGRPHRTEDCRTVGHFAPEMLSVPTEGRSFFELDVLSMERY